MRALASIATTLATVAIVGCTVHQTSVPTVAGPSGLALSLSVTATPDSLSQDGGSQSSIKIVAIGPTGQPMPALTLRLDMDLLNQNGALVPQDYGTLSARTIVTGNDGAASVVYTAPPSPAGGISGTCSSLPGTCVFIVATPFGSGFETANPQMVTIRLVPPGVILPPAGTPTAAFTTSPSQALMNVPVTFDASTSAIGVGATQITSYSWSFGDSTRGTGRTVTHTFTSQQTFNVTLTIVNDRGLAASTSLQVSVGALAAPAPKFVFSPTAPVVGQIVLFNADQSTAAPGHTLTAFNWSFGDGATASGFVASHAFATAGTYNVVLSVLDDTGQKGTTSLSVTAGSPTPPAPPVADFVSSPPAPHAGDVVSFISTSTTPSGAAITSYSWNFGDQVTCPAVCGAGSQSAPTHVYLPGSVGTRTVNVILTVTDSNGLTSTKVVSVSITTP